MGNTGECDDLEKIRRELLGEIEAWYGEFSKSRHFEALTQEQKEKSNFVLTAFAEFMYVYHGLLPGEWDAKGLEECCLDTFPRKVSAEVALFRSIAPVLSAFFAFAGETKKVPKPLRLIEKVRQIGAQIVKNSENPELWGHSKSFAMAATKAGVNIENPAEIDAFIRVYNQQQMQEYQKTVEAGGKESRFRSSGKKKAPGMNKKPRQEEKSLKNLFTDMPEKRGMKNICKKEGEYAGVLAPIEFAIASCYLRYPHLKDGDAVLALKNFRVGYDKKFDNNTLEFIIQKAALIGLERFTKNKKISEHEFLIAIDYVLWAISNRGWVPDERAYLKWACNFFGLLEGEEKKEYESFYEKLGHRLNIPKRRLEILKGHGGKQTDVESPAGDALQDEDGRIISHKISRNEPCPCGSGKKYKKCCLGKSMLHGVGS